MLSPPSSDLMSLSLSSDYHTATQRNENNDLRVPYIHIYTIRIRQHFSRTMDVP
jgi:hypothetical protein